MFDGSIRLHLQSYLVESDSQESRLDDEPEQSLINLLTQREREVLRLLMNGDSNQEVANALFLSEPTIKKIVSRIISKLQVQNRVQAAVYGAKHLRE